MIIIVLNFQMNLINRGRMIPSELERLVQERFAQGHKPYFVNCTCGTTVVGAFDQINPIADICEKYNLWLHIDVNLAALMCLHVFKFTIANKV
jgi:glutamate/tyrosine decarboxylase-like PLP-dependent enzyme